MKPLFLALAGERDFPGMANLLSREKKPVLASGVSADLKTALFAAAAKELARPAVLFYPTEKEASDAAAALAPLFPDAAYFPPRDFAFANFDSVSRDFSGQRLSVLTRLERGEASLVVTTPAAALQQTAPPALLRRAQKKIRPGDGLTPQALLDHLASAGYARVDRVEGAGQMALRGDIFDVYLPDAPAPCRVEFFGDEVDTLSFFDPITQRRERSLDSLSLCPAEEIWFSPEQKDELLRFLKEEEEKTPASREEMRRFFRETAERIGAGMAFASDLFVPLLYERANLLSYCGDVLFCLSDQESCREAVEAQRKMLAETLKYLAEENRVFLPANAGDLAGSFDDLRRRLEESRTLLCENFFAGKSPIAPAGLFSFRTRRASASFQNLALLEEDVKNYLADGYRVVMLCENRFTAENFRSLYEDRGTPCALLEVKNDAELLPGRLYALPRSPETALFAAGFELADQRLAVLTDENPNGAKKRFRRREKFSGGEKILSYADLAPGDYVVHRSHGIGRFEGTETIRGADVVKRDFLKISYAGSDVLYVPCQNLDAVAKYIGPKSDSADLKLNRLGSGDWQKVRARAKSAARDIAKKLIDLYARRQKTPGFAFSPDSPWQAEFEEQFPYEETESQLRATAELKADMEKPYPMDRLLCGDVGFGKTEVALRGIFKCVMDGKQAAMLVPTTILAWQHYQTMLARFQGYPVRIAMLSRFVKKKEQEKIIERIALGEVDIVVGTHRLLQKDCEFPALGLLVVDEEQRFGVTHKERLKELSIGVDVLSLSATPIPRTLNMAMGGIKDLSVLEEAPGDRFPVQSYVLEYDQGLIFEAIRRELRRGGQVFYLHNNIEELEARRFVIEREFPDAAVAVAHGKLGRDELSDIWKAMMDREIDILLCTTIIETGIDLPDANTLIMENADNFGLSQLHQIRGRVGRSDRKAYAYFTYRRGKALSEISVKRLEAIRAYTEFGSGFKIALRDLEIRGAGDLLGAEQHGHLNSVGFDAYMRILSEAIAEEKGEPLPEKTECQVLLTLNAYLPETYVSSPQARLDLYRKFALCASKEDDSDLLDEIIDRFGAPPKEVEHLFAVCRVKRLAETLSCVKIHELAGQIVFTFERGKVSEAAAALLSSVYGPRLTLSLTGTPQILLSKPEGALPTEPCEELLDLYASFCRETAAANDKERN